MTGVQTCALPISSTPIYMELAKNGKLADLMETGAIVKTAFFEAGAIFGFFVAALLNAAHAGQESTIFKENDNGTE